MARITIVDDDEDFSWGLGRILTQAGHDVETIHDTASALRALPQQPPDLIILDVMFGDDTDAGFDLARELRRPESPVRATPILMLTSINEFSSVKFGPTDIDPAWLPVTDFIEKPIDPDALKEKVNALLAKREGTG